MTIGSSIRGKHSISVIVESCIRGGIRKQQRHRLARTVSIEEYLCLRQSCGPMSTIKSQSRGHLCRSGLNLDTPLSHLRPNSSPTSSLDEEGSKTMSSPENDVKLLSNLSRRFYSILMGFNWCGHSYFALWGTWPDSILRNQSFVRAVNDFGMYAPAARGIQLTNLPEGSPLP